MSSVEKSQARDGRVVVVGAGPVGCATAAYLQDQEIEVALYSPTARRVRKNGRASFRTQGALAGEFELELIEKVDRVGHADTLIICLPADAFLNVLDPVIPFLRSGQNIVVSGALSLAPLWLAKRMSARGIEVAVGGWGTTLTTAHFVGDRVLHVNAMRQRIDIAMMGVGADRLLAVCSDLYGDRFVAADNLISTTLANINPIAHAAEVIPNLTRMDQAESWSLFGNFSMVVGRIAEALDQERLATARAFGFELPSLRAHYANSYGVKSAELHKMAAQITHRAMSPFGPTSLTHRYIKEDGPFGMVVLERLARKVDVHTPVLTSAITMLEIATDTDLRGRNPFLDDLGFDDLDPHSLVSLCAAERSIAIERN